MKLANKVYALITILSAMLLCTACGKAKRENIADELKENLGVIMMLTVAEMHFSEFRI